MSFDPYRRWLGIPPSEQPPNCYRLLGIALLEEDQRFSEVMALQLTTPDVEVLSQRRYDEAQELFDSVNNPLRDLYAKLDQRSGGQARMKKGMMALMGWPLGASRPPSLPLNEEEMSQAAEALDFERAALLRDQLFEVKAEGDGQSKGGKATRRPLAEELRAAAETGQ